MKRLFIDTNILIDLIADRKPYSKHAIRIFKLATQKKVRLYTSGHAIATTWYILKPYKGDKDLRKILFDLLDYVTPIAINESTLRKGLKSKYKDFEDALQIFSALTINEMDYIITRNIKDFKGSPIEVLTPDEFLAKLT